MSGSVFTKDVREALRHRFEGVVEGDPGHMSATVCQSLFQGAGMEYEDACRWADVIAGSVWTEVQHVLDDCA